MKRLHVCVWAMMLCPIVLLAQAVSNTQVQEVVALPGMNKTKVFEKSLQWIAQSFVSGKSVIEYQDAKSGKIMGNCSIPYVNSPASAWHINTTIAIDVKDFKARLTLTGTSIYSTHKWFRRSGSDAPWDVREDDIPEVRKELQKLVGAFTLYMSQKSDDNW